jgi:hypothetical protein
MSPGFKGAGGKFLAFCQTFSCRYTKKGLTKPPFAGTIEKE